MKTGDGWTLFLDRDGVINQKPPEHQHVKSVYEFKFIDSVFGALKILSKKFDRIIVVTNQQGIGRGEMTEMDLEHVHEFMLNHVSVRGGRIDAVYYCPHVEGMCVCRKPLTGLALEAQRDFPEIDFEKSYVAGDSIEDMKFAWNLGAVGVLVGSAEYTSLYDFAQRLT